MPHEKRLPDVLLSRLVLSNGSAFMTLSPKEGERLVNLIPSARVYASHLPVPQVIHPAEGRAEIRSVMGFAPDQPVLLFFGIVRPYKGLRVLLEALASLPDKAQPPHLLVVGEFWEAVEEYQSRVNELAIADRVTIENRYVPNEELARFFTAADAFVAPYTSGTQSAAVKMAMSYRLPILASDQISSDLPVDTYPVYIHRAGDACDLSHSIQEFLDLEPGTYAEQPVGSDWSDIISLVERIWNELSPAGSRGPRSGNP
jgi:glycosyltransferase involved in cell wall biosynthesis